MSHKPRECVNLDHNAITRPLEVSISHFIETARNELNPSSVHLLGKGARSILERSREMCLAELDCTPCMNLVFTSNCTEANNIVIFSRFFDDVITSSIEHPSVLGPARTRNAIVTPVNHYGEVDLNSLQSTLGDLPPDRRVLVSVILAHNEVGVVQPISKIEKIVHARENTFLHCDISQVVGKFRFSARDVLVDIATFSSQKAHSVPGAGVIVYNSTILLTPIAIGGGQERYWRPGTHNLPAINALAHTLKVVCSEEYLGEYHSNTLKLRNALEEGVLELGGVVACRGANGRLSNTSMLAMPGVEHYVQLIEFDLHKIMVSNGSSCSSGKVEVPNSVRALAIPDIVDDEILANFGLKKSGCRDIENNFVRVSTDSTNTIDDIEFFLSIWRKLSKRSVSR